MRGILLLSGIVLALGVVLSGGMAVAQEAEYVGNSQCKICHNVEAEGAQWKKWSEEKHHKALETLQGDAAKAVAEKAGVTTPPAESPECLKCHVTAYNAETKSAPEKIKLEDGVQCESCHGPASLHVADGKIVKFQKDKAAEIDIAAHIKSDVGEEKCKECHNADSPTWNPERYTTASGEKVGFDFEQAWAKINHDNPKTTD